MDHAPRHRQEQKPGHQPRSKPTDNALKDLVFRSFPAELEDALLEEDDFDLEDDPEETDDDVDAIEDLDEESEFEDIDEDALPQNEEPEELPGEIDGPSPESSRVDRPEYVGNAYELIVANEADGRMTCEFQHDPWIRRRRKNLDFYLMQLTDFLNAAAKWMETFKQDFLKNPTAGAFLLGETEETFKEDPVVTKKGFVKRVAEDMRLSCPLKEDQFSSVSQYIVLVWEDDGHMYLNDLFTAPFQIQWVAAGCHLKWPNPEAWRKLLAKRSSLSTQPKAKTAKASRDEFQAQDPRQRLSYLLKRVKLNSDENVDCALNELTEAAKDAK